MMMETKIDGDAPLLVLSKEQLRIVEPKLPTIVVDLSSGERWRYKPQRDITTYEIARLLELFMCRFVSVDIDGWWAEAGPEIWRHFEEVKR